MDFMMFPLTLETKSPEDTENIGRSLFKMLQEDISLPHFVALYGDLGVGKTAFVRGFVSAMSPNTRVQSPTYTLVNEYRTHPFPIFHFDMYRIHSEDELYSIGYYDYLDRPGVCLVEWSENISEFLPEERLSVTIQKTSPEHPDDRKICIKRIGAYSPSKHDYENTCS